MRTFDDHEIERMRLDREARIDARLREVAPAFADVPDDVSRFLANVQRMLAASNGAEATRYAAVVARDAETVALMHVEWVRLRGKIAERER